MPVGTCRNCGNSFYWKQVSKQQSFCSRSCSATWRTANGSGVRPAPSVPAGTVREMSNGYLIERVAADDPMRAMGTSMRGNWVWQHRLVVARSIGRPLVRTESVHHLNGDRADNRIENLELRSTHHGKGQRFVCVDCGSPNVRPTTLAQADKGCDEREPARGSRP